ncbi:MULTISPECIES: hypothetical protein [Pseudomonas]|nr:MULTISPECIES: hypothetical protein [Pseudomonas]MCD4528167.1 hypothetical protein [Pseudomonas sp. C3-2018]
MFRQCARQPRLGHGREMMSQSYTTRLDQPMTSVVALS